MRLMYSSAWVVAVVVLCVAFAHAQQLYEGDGCSLSDGGEGVCRTAASCPGVREQISGGVFPKICSFANNSQPIVCCRQVASTTAAPPASQTPPTTPTPMTTNGLTPWTWVSRVDENTKAGRKCREYARYVYVEVVSNPSLRIPERYNKSECVMPAVERRVFGGDEAIAKEFPHMAALGFGRKEDIQWKCAGTLISERFVLTVAHCVSSHINDPMRWVRLGDLNLYSDEDDAQPITVAVAERIPHEEYKAGSHYNDIGLVKLERDVTFSPYIRPACLYTLQGDPPGKVNAMTTGWGTLGWLEQVGSDVLKKISVHFQDESICKRAYDKMYTLKFGITPESMICAISPEEGKDTCSGDSGAPLQLRMLPPDPFCMYSVVGLTSFGFAACGLPEIATVYTRVSNFIPWIERHVWQ